VRATFIDAGHILGSASILLELEEPGHSTSALFSGDLGSPGRPLLRGPATPPHAENVVMETTYGDRLHKGLGPSIDEFYEAVTETFKRGGNVIIPTFALERAQELLYFLSGGVAQGRLAKSMQVYLDSPMAISATEIFRRHAECLDPATAKSLQEGHDPFALPGLHFTRETAESVAINSVRGGAVIMAGAGMCTGGRVRHHLQHNLGRDDSSIVFVGYAAVGTLARDIVDGAKQARSWFTAKKMPCGSSRHGLPIHGSRCRSRIKNSFCERAPRRCLVGAWLVLGRTAKPERTFAAGKPVEVTRVRITDAGRRASPERTP
jgi:metallo-beta-lactamase family protein